MKTANLGDVCNIIGGGTPSKSNDAFYGGDIPWATVRDMRSEILDNTEHEITIEAVNQSSTNIIPKDNVVIATRVGLGKVCFLAQDTAINQDLRGVLPKNENQLDVRFLFWWLQSVSNLIIKAGTGATVQGVKLPFVKGLQIPLFTLPKQKRIVAILDEAFAGIDQAIANTEKNLASARELFESYLNNIFIQAGNQSQEMLLSDISTIFAGGDVNKERLSDTKTEKYSVPIFTNGEKNKGLYGYTDEARIFEPSLTVSARGTIGYCEIRNEPFYPAVRLIVITPNMKTMNLDYLRYSIKRLTIDHSGVSIPQLTVPMIKNYKVPVPSLDVQTDIADKLDSLYAELEYLNKLAEQKIIACNELKQSLLQKAFSGELTSDMSDEIAEAAE